MRYLSWSIHLISLFLGVITLIALFNQDDRGHIVFVLIGGYDNIYLLQSMLILSTILDYLISKWVKSACRAADD